MGQAAACGVIHLCVVGLTSWVRWAKLLTPLVLSKLLDVSNAASDRDIIFVAVPTPHKEMYDGSFPTSHLPSCDFDYNIVKDVLNRLNKII